LLRVLLLLDPAPSLPLGCPENAGGWATALTKTQVTAREYPNRGQQIRVRTPFSSLRSPSFVLLLLVLLFLAPGPSMPLGCPENAGGWAAL